MKKALNIFFVTLGVIFFIILIYLFFFSPVKISSILGAKDSATTTQESNSSSAVDKNPLLSPSQEKTLETFGVDPSKLPTSITPEMEACFVAKLGSTRVNEIKAGSSPTTADFFTARSCL
jgi:hypothetical protein